MATVLKTSAQNEAAGIRWYQARPLSRRLCGSREPHQERGRTATPNRRGRGRAGLTGRRRSQQINHLARLHGEGIHLRASRYLMPEDNATFVLLETATACPRLLPRRHLLLCFCLDCSAVAGTGTLCSMCLRGQRSSVAAAHSKTKDVSEPAISRLAPCSEASGGGANPRSGPSRGRTWCVDGEQSDADARDRHRHGTLCSSLHRACVR